MEGCRDSVPAGISPLRKLRNHAKMGSKSKEVRSMRFRFIALLLAIVLLLTGCGYLLVEDAPVQVGSSLVQEAD